MHFEEDAIYHIYNRSNETVFRTHDNYLFFLSKIKEYIFPYCNVLAWCLMPNHFHLLIQSTKDSIQNCNRPNQPYSQILSLKIGLLTGSYTQAFNKQNGRRGRLFSHQTKAKLLNDEVIVYMNGSNLDYATTCFLYIHQNPVLAGLVDKPEDWEFSSFQDYIRKRNGKLVNKKRALEIICLDEKDIYQQSMLYLGETFLKDLF